jgi:glucan biosynthesis protein C
MTVSNLQTARRNDIDALRILATFMLFVFHTAMIFNPAPFFHIRNDELSIVFLIVCGFISLWHMPLFFFLAGWSLYRSIESRGGRGVLRERLTRIGIPLLLGSALFGPGLKYLELSSGVDLNYAGLRVRADLQDSFKEVIPSGLETLPPFDESFLEFLPTFFTQLERFTWSHLWFLAYLLTFSLLYLPVLLRIASRQHRTLNVHRWWLYTPIVVLAAIQVTLRPHWPGIQNLYNDWANFAFYSTFLLLGFAFARAPEIERLAHEERNRATVVGLLACLVLLLAVFEVVTSSAVVLAGTAVAGWCFVVALLGFAHSRITTRSPALAYLSEAAYPVYILHQPAIVFIGYPILTLAIGITAKFVLITTLAIAASLFVYQFAVRRSPILRVATGMAADRAQRFGQLNAPVAVGAMLLCFVFVSSAAAETNRGPFGLWLAEGGSAKVRIARCSGELCGHVEWLHAPLGRNGCPLRDERNPTKELRDRPVEGLKILSGLKPSDQDDTWVDGAIYDPSSGSTYRCTLRIIDNDTLELRGYIGIPLIGRSTAWFRAGTNEERCEQDAGGRG